MKTAVLNINLMCDTHVILSKLYNILELTHETCVIKNLM